MRRICLLIILLTLLPAGCFHGPQPYCAKATEFLEKFYDVPDYSAETYEFDLMKFKNYFTPSGWEQFTHDYSYPLEMVAFYNRRAISLDRVNFTVDKSKDEDGLIFLNYAATIKLVNFEEEKEDYVTVESDFPMKMIQENDQWKIDFFHPLLFNEEDYLIPPYLKVVKYVDKHPGNLSATEVVEKFLRMVYDVPDYSEKNTSEKMFAYQPYVTDQLFQTLFYNSLAGLVTEIAAQNERTMSLSEIEFNVNREEDEGKTVYLDYMATVKLTGESNGDVVEIKVESTFPLKLIKKDDLWLVDYYDLVIFRSSQFLSGSLKLKACW